MQTPTPAGPQQACKKPQYYHRRRRGCCCLLLLFIFTLSLTFTGLKVCLLYIQYIL